MDDALDPLATLLPRANVERPARLYLIGTATGVDAAIYHYGPIVANEYVLAVGTDALACLTRGSVEGVPCTWDSTTMLAEVTGSPFPSIQPPFQTFSLFNLPTGEDRLFIVQKNPNAPAQTPGSFRAVVGFWPYPLADGETTMVPIVPEASRRAGEVLAPSPVWCTHANLTCAGERFDARLPLENELSTDHTSIENSWQYWLSLARAAADESDRLAELVITEGTANDLRAESAAAELEELCGGSVDLDALLSDDLTDARGGDCSSSACATGYICEQNECIRDPLLVLQDLATAGENPGAARLVECLGSDQVADYIALGANPICFWRRTGSPNDICGDAMGRDCPLVVSDPTSTECDDEFDPPPAGHEWVFVGERLGYFESDAPGSGQVLAPPPCEALRTARDPANPITIPLVQEITSGYFEPVSMRRAASRVGWEARIHDYSTLTLDGRPWGLTTGDTYGGPAGGYPCVGNPGDPVCSTSGQDGDPLFGCVIQCGDAHQRSIFNDRLLRAVLVAREIHYLSPRAITLPLPRDDLRFYGAADRVAEAGDPLRTYQVDYPEHEAEGAVRVPQVCATTNAFGPTRLWRYHRTFFTGLETGSLPFGGDVVGTCSPDNAYIALVDASELYRGDADRFDFPPYDFWVGMGAVTPLPDGGRYSERYDWVPSIRETLFGELTHGTSLRYEQDRPVARPHPSTDLLPNGWRVGSTIDAVEVLCEAGNTGGSVFAGCDPDSPPSVNSLSDIENAQKYLECGADGINRFAERVVFANIPARAVDALREDSVVGTYPAVGGRYGTELSTIRTSLTELALTPLARERRASPDRSRYRSGADPTGSHRERKGTQPACLSLDSVRSAYVLPRCRTPRRYLQTWIVRAGCSGMCKLSHPDRSRTAEP